MYELILLRHAHAQPQAEQGNDLGRGLSLHGETEAAAAGRWLHKHSIHPTRVLCSPSQRTRQTAKLALSTAGIEPSLEFAEEIYNASPGELLALLDQYAEDRSVLLVGHNPGIERLVPLLVEGRSDDYRGMPTGSIAVLHLSGALEPGNASMESFWSP